MSDAESTSRPRLVLVVEDSAIVALDVELSLLDAGYRVLGRDAARWGDLRSAQALALSFA